MDIQKIGNDPLNVYNSAVAIDPNGKILGSYRKVHPFGSEVIWAKTGTEPFLLIHLGERLELAYVMTHIIIQN